MELTGWTHAYSVPANGRDFQAVPGSRDADHRVNSRGFRGDLLAIAPCHLENDLYLCSSAAGSCLDFGFGYLVVESLAETP